MKRAAQLYGKVLDCQNPDHSALSWDQAVGEIIEGEAAFMAMGDWVYGELAKAGLKENRDFGWVNLPRYRGSVPRGASRKPARGRRSRKRLPSKDGPIFVGFRCASR